MVCHCMISVARPSAASSTAASISAPFEYQQASDLNLVVDTLVDESDGNYGHGHLSLRKRLRLLISIRRKIPFASIRH